MNLAITMLAALTAFHPGAEWNDTDGNPIQAHGGSVIVAEGKYWFIGEDKKMTDGTNDIRHWGMHAYSSTDLYNWKNEGLFIEPDENAPMNSLRNPRSASDRPHIIYNEKTKKYVCWVKVMQATVQMMTVLTADRVIGPYTIVRENFKPDNFSSGDFDLVKENGKAYIVYEEPHTRLNVTELTDDYCGTVGMTTSHFGGLLPPFTREAPAHFERHGKHYLFTSGTTSYWPNPTLVAEAESVLGPWKNLGPACRGDVKETSFDCQVSSVFKVPGKKDCYIAIGDRWLPNDPNTYADSSNAFVVVFNQIKEGPEKLASDRFWGWSAKHPPATKFARYVWLPVKFDGERPYLEWRDTWSLDEFEDEK